MKTFNRTLLFTGALLLSSLAASTSGAMQSTMAMDNMEEMIVTASSTQDHETLATRYASEAQSLRDLAEHHKRMAQTYDNLASGSGKSGYAGMAAHCHKLAAKFAEAAAEYAQLATLHQQFAAELAAKTTGAS